VASHEELAVSPRQWGAARSAARALGRQAASGHWLGAAWRARSDRYSDHPRKREEWPAHEAEFRRVLAEVARRAPVESIGVMWPSY